MPAPGAKIAVIGFELGDGPLMQAWAQAGYLPALRSIIDEGCSGWLETSADRLHISAWPSIYTGADPGEHGVYYTFQPAPGLQGWQRFHPGLYGRPTLWKLLDEAGCRGQHHSELCEVAAGVGGAGFGVVERVAGYR